MSIKSLITGFILIFIAAASTVLLIKSRKADSLIQKKPRQDLPDLIVTNSKLTTYTDKGLIKSISHADKTIHYPKNDATVMVAPKILIYTSTRVPWNIHADHGMLTQGTKVAKLWGNVVLHQPKHKDGQETTVTTTELTFYPDKSFAETDQDVTIIRPDSKLQSHGMTADLKKGILVTKSQTRGTFNETNKQD